jgi:hypothetical protein
MQSGAIFKEDECVVCLDQASTKIFDPCRHKCVCDACCEIILKEKLDCPMCRSVITIIVEDQEVAQISKREWDEFKVARKDYVAKFTRAASNALFAGKSKQARAISKRACSELEQRYKETKGGEICMSKQKTVEEKDGRLLVSYKVGRKTFREDYPIYDIPEELKDKEDLELAIEYPEIYWLRFNNKKKLKL